MQNLGLLRIALFSITPLLFSFGSEADEYCSYPVRIASVYYDLSSDSGKIPEGFLKYAKNLGYNYVMVEFPPNVNRTILKSAFESAVRGGMRLVPKLQTSGRWAYNWKLVYPQITQMNLMKRDKQGRIFGSNSYSIGCGEDESTFDFHFLRTLKEIAGAFKATCKKEDACGDLDFIHLGHDEPFGVLDGKRHLLAGFGDSTYSTKDREYVQQQLAEGNCFSAAVKKLLVREILGRIEQVHQSVSEQTRVIIYADIWDRNFLGGVWFETYARSKVRMIDKKWWGQADLTDLPGLTKAEKDFVRKNLVLMPYYSWDISFEGRKIVDYNPMDTYKALSRKNFSLISGACLDTVLSEGELASVESMCLNVRKIHDAATRVKGVIGFSANSWHVWIPGKGVEKQDWEYTVISHMGRLFCATTSTMWGIERY